MDKTKPGVYSITVNGIKPDSIHDYVDQLEDKYHKLQTENQRLREALEKALWCMAYTNGDNGSEDWSEHDSRLCDCRAIAKQALAETGGDDVKV